MSSYPKEQIATPSLFSSSLLYLLTLFEALAFTRLVSYTAHLNFWKGFHPLC